MKHPKVSKLAFIFVVVSNIVYLSWRLFYTLPLNEDLWILIFGILLLMSEMVAVYTAFVMFWSKGKKWELKLPDIDIDDYPRIDVFIATHNEPYELLYKTINACSFMEYPDKSKVNVYVCDDNNRVEIKELAHSLGVQYIGLTGNTQAKSGNLNNAMSQTSAPIILTFDADMIPNDQFLMKTAPYFLLPQYQELDDGTWVKREVPEDYEIGFIQTPQNFYNPDIFHFNLSAEEYIPNEQDFFSRELNTSHNGVQAAIYTGSNTLISRKAIEECGGFPVNTITEDFQLGVLIQSKGYKSYATEEILASGLTPDTFEAVVKQRVRWARGVIQSIYNVNLLFLKGLTWQQKVIYSTSYLYWWSFFRRIIYIVAPILFGLFSIRLVDNSFFILLLFWLPAYFSMNLYMQHLAGNIRTQRWGEIYETILAPFMVLPVFFESLGIKEREFKITNKDKVNTKKKRFNVAILPHLFLLLMCILAFINFNAHKTLNELFYGMVINFWLIHHIINLSYSIFFAFDRVIYRSFQRFPSHESLVIEHNGAKTKANIDNISEQGLAIILKKLNLEIGENYSMYIPNDKYPVKIQAKLIRISKSGDDFIYSFRNEVVDDKRFYLQHVYSGYNHGLPLIRDQWYTEFDALFNAFNSRKSHEEPSKVTLVHSFFDDRVSLKKIVLDDYYMYVYLDEKFLSTKLESLVFKDHTLLIKDKVSSFGGLSVFEYTLEGESVW